MERVEAPDGTTTRRRRTLAVDSQCQPQRLAEREWQGTVSRISSTSEVQGMMYAACAKRKTVRLGVVSPPHPVLSCSMRSLS